MSIRMSKWLSFFVVLFILVSQVKAQWVKVSGQTAGVGGNLFSHKSTLFLTGNFNGFKMYRSDNGGTTWTSIADKFPYDVYSVFSYKEEVFAVTTTLGSGIYRFYVSSDNGVNWTERSNIPSVTGNGAILSMTADGNTLYAISNRKSFYTSTNNGVTWTEKIINTSASGNLISLAVSGNNFVSVILGTGAVVSTNGGQSWEIKNPASVTISSVYYYNGTIYGIPSGGGLFKFNNNTQSWDPTTGLPDVLTFEIPKSMAGYGNLLFVYYVGFLTGQGSVYSSNDGGSSWTKLNSTGLPATVSPGNSISSITATSTDLFLYNQTQSGSTVDESKTGLYKTGISPTSIKSLDNLPSQYSLLQNYPNPFNPSTKISFSIPATQLVSLKIYDLTGREISSLINRELNAGSYSFEFDGSNLSSGIYFYRLNTANFSDVKKMILIK